MQQDLCLKYGHFALLTTIKIVLIKCMMYLHCHHPYFQDFICILKELLHNYFRMTSELLKKYPRTTSELRKNYLKITAELLQNFLRITSLPRFPIWCMMYLHCYHPYFQYFICISLLPIGYLITSNPGWCIITSTFKDILTAVDVVM